MRLNQVRKLITGKQWSELSPEEQKKYQRDIMYPGRYQDTDYNYVRIEE